MCIALFNAGRCRLRTSSGFRRCRGSERKSREQPAAALSAAHHLLHHLSRLLELLQKLIYLRDIDARAFRDAADLIEAGADIRKWNQLLFRKASPGRIKLEGLIYGSMSFHHEGKVVVALVTDEMLRQAGATEDDCDDLAGLAGRVEGGEVSITIRDWPGGASKVSVRSGESFDSCALCARFGGGGHRMASGCNIPVPPAQARELLLQAIDEVWA